MNKTKKIIYWIATIWLALGMLSTGMVQLLQVEDEMEMMRRLDYPDYFSAILGVWKILGVIAILVPKMPVVKEWAYAGFFFTATGAIISHICTGDAVSEIFPALLLLVLIVTSWYLRPDSRKTKPAQS